MTPMLSLKEFLFNPDWPKPPPPPGPPNDKRWWHDVPHRRPSNVGHLPSLRARQRD